MSPIHCSLCGEYTTPVDFSQGDPVETSTTSEAGGSWRSRLRFIFPTFWANTRLWHSNQLRHTKGDVLSEIPYLSNKARFTKSEGFFSPNIEIWDRASGEYLRQFLYPFRNFRQPGLRVGCYPVHEACWNIFWKLISDDNPQVTRARILKFYDILLNTTIEKDQLLLPYGGHSQGLPCPLSLRLPFSSDDPWDLADTSELVTISNREVSTNIHLIPQILPLPVELVEYIYSFLDWSDIENIRTIATNNWQVLPERFWKSFLLPNGELGYFDFNLPKELQDLSYLKKCELAKSLWSLTNGFKNRHRIWKFSKAFAKLVDEVIKRGEFGIQETTTQTDPLASTRDQSQELIAQSESYAESEGFSSRLWNAVGETLYEGELDASEAKEIVLYYAGFADLQYLAGIEFLPGREKLGYITSSFRKVSLISKKYVLSAASRSGIVDLMFVASDDETGSKFSTDELEDRNSAIKYRSLEPSLHGLRDIKVQCRWDEIKMTEICFETTNILPPKELSSDEGFMQSCAWTPRPPPRSVGKLNSRNYCGRVVGGGAKFDSTGWITFPEAPLTRITGWMRAVRSISWGLTFHFENPKENPPLTIGRQDGAALDFPINGSAGEYLASASALTDNKNGDVCGLMMETNFGRKSLMNGCWKYYDIRPLVPENSGRIIGFYAPHKGQGYLSSIGAITSLTPEEPTPITAIIEDTGYDTACVVQPECNATGDFTNIGVGGGSHFVSRASLKDCYRITCFSRENVAIEFPNAQERLTGLQLEYKTRPTNFNNYRVLGQLSGGDPLENVLTLKEGEEVLDVIAYLDLAPVPIAGGGYRLRPLKRPAIVAGLRITTSSGRSVVWGEEKEHQARRWRLAPESIIRWDFDAFHDRFRVENYVGSTDSPASLIVTKTEGPMEYTIYA